MSRCPNRRRRVQLRYAWRVATELEDVAYLFRVLADVDYRSASPLYDRLTADGAPRLLARAGPHGAWLDVG
jgi:hypothetical protein